MEMTDVRKDTGPEAEPMRFLEYLGEVYRVLLATDTGSWVIRCMASEAPLFVCAEELERYTPVPTPDSFLAAPGEVSAARQKRMDMIAPLLEDRECIVSRRRRQDRAKRQAEQYGTTSARIVRLYLRYLATGQVMDTWKRPNVERPEFDAAIRKYYFSSRKFSLRAVYEMLVLESYTGSDGSIQTNVPSWHSFRSYYYSRCYHKQERKVIAREGLGEYQRNHRPAFGSAAAWRPQVGSYQMDATVANVYLVSRLDRKTVIGRPIIYLAVDTATQLIAGVYVGLDSGEQAVMSCLASAAENKRDFCRRHGLTLTMSQNQWPNAGVPLEIITDRGREFTGARMQELSRRYGVELQSLPPYRPDLKSFVERTFGLLQEKYAPLLRGRGYIEEAAQERYSVDYRSQAVLTLEEFTQIVLHCVIFANSVRRLPCGKTPAELWLEQSPKLLEVDAGEIYRMSLPRREARLTRSGFKVNGMFYVPGDMDGLTIGDTYTIAYDVSDLRSIYIVGKDSYRTCTLAQKYTMYAGVTKEELKAAREQASERSRDAERRETEGSIAVLRNIQGVVAEAASQCEGTGSRQDGADIRRQREAEKGLVG